MTKPSVGNTGRHDLAGSADYFPGKNCCQRCGLWVSDIGKHINEKYCAGLGVAAPKEDSILWDRLRADLANLGAAYGELPTTIVTPGTWAHHPQESIEWSAVSDPTSWAPTVTISEEQARERWPEPDYDAILLAARKKRERSQVVDMSDHGHHWGHNVDGCERCGLTGTEILTFKSVADIPACDGGKARDLRNKLSQAMDRPLSFPKRIGWKPGDCE